MQVDENYKEKEKKKKEIWGWNYGEHAWETKTTNERRNQEPMTGPTKWANLV